MATPAMLVGTILRVAIIFLSCFWAASFFIVRLAVFVEAFKEARQIQHDEMWMMAQCQDPQFYSHMRRHTDLCFMVQRNSERSPWLYAMNALADTAHLCGRYSCQDMIISLGDKGWPIMVWAALALVLGNMFLCLVQRFFMFGKLSTRVYKDPIHCL